MRHWRACFVVSGKRKVCLLLTAQLQSMELTRDAPLMKLGSAQSKVPAAWRLVYVKVAKNGASFTYALNRKKLKLTRRREGRYLAMESLLNPTQQEAVA